LKILQPEKLKDETFTEELRKLNADLQIVVAFRMLPEVVWNMPPLGTYNLHASLLPKYRGAAPINWAIINGEKETGVTTFKLKHEIDTGNVLFQEKVAISDTMTAGELHDKLMVTGATLVLKSVKAIESGNYELKPQPDVESTHAPKIFRETCRIDWNNAVKKIYDLIRGLSPYPAAFTEFKDQSGSTQTFKLFSAAKESASHNHPNGLVVTDGRSFLKAACGDGYISISELQMQGKKRMKIEEFLRGYKFPEPTVFL
jgi:methionyl-tRNA formyltransferase